MKDILINFENETIFKDGDLDVGECDEQNKQLLLVCEKNSFKEFPATCVGIGSYLENEDQVGLTREVRAQFQADGMKVKNVQFDGSDLKIDASY